MMDNIKLTEEQKKGLTQEEIDKLEMKLIIEFEANTYF